MVRKKWFVQTLFHPELHPVFEAAGFMAGYGFYKFERSRRGDFLSHDRRWAIIAAASVGALIGSKLLGFLESAPAGQLDWRTLFTSGGKTIIGGLLGGWLTVELIKRILGVTSRTGDLFVVPICLGIAMGRLGCFVAGLADDTYGLPTSLPWGIDFGDGVPRHPTQLYESLFVVVLGAGLWIYNSRSHVRGRAFRIFMAAYLAWRLVIDEIKPREVIWHLSVLQWTCLAALLILTASEIRNTPQPIDEHEL